MATIEQTKEVSEEIELTPDYCFSKAAEALTHPGWPPSGDWDLRFVAEWRLLGEAIHNSQRKLIGDP